MSLTHSYSSRTIAYAGFLPTWGWAVLRRHLGQFGVSVCNLGNWGQFDIGANPRNPLLKVKILISSAYFSVVEDTADFFNRIGRSLPVTTGSEREAVNELPAIAAPNGYPVAG